MGKKLNKVVLFVFALLMMPLLALGAIAPNVSALALGMNLITTGPVPPGIGGNDNSQRPSISADGSKIVFWSRATDLIPGTTTSGNTQIYLYDTVTNTTKLITAGPSGTESNNTENYPYNAISADGSKIAFMSNATDLVGAPTSGGTNIFLYDIATSTTTLVTAGPTGTGVGLNGYWGISISANGSKITFDTQSDNLVGAETDGNDTNIFLYDVTTGTTTLVTKGGGLMGGDGGSHQPTISADGSKIVFSSRASDLVAGVTSNVIVNVFLYDVATDSTTLITKGPSPYVGSDNPDDGRATDISADNNLIVFSSHATNLINGVTANGNRNVYLYNVATGVTTLITAGASGVGGDRNSFPASISANGSVIGFSSDATDLIAGETTDGSAQNVFTYEVASGKIELVTKGSSGIGGNANALRPTFSASGCTMTFHSDATDLIAGLTTNSNSNIFAFARCLEPTTGPEMPNAGYFGKPSSDTVIATLLPALSLILLTSGIVVASKKLTKR